MMEEPSVLDYVKTKLQFWKKESLVIAPESEATAASEEPSLPTPALEGSQKTWEESTSPDLAEGAVAVFALKWPWRSFLALLLAIAGQFSMGPEPERTWKTGVILIAISLAFLAWAYLRDEWRVSSIPDQSPEFDPPRINLLYLLVGSVVAILAFVSFGVLKFTFYNLGFLAVALVLVIRAFWVSQRKLLPEGEKSPGRPQRMGWSLSINRSTLFNLAAVAAAIAVVAFFRFYRLDQVPPEMNSDHAEKIMDILRVLAGGTSIFFPNNGGREAGQMYLVAGLHKYFGVPLNFMGLKLATTLVGFLALPFIYLLGKEIASHRVGLLAFLFAGVAYWPNVVARAGMRLPFYILFTAATLYFLLRGIRRGSRNDFIWAGVSLGLSFYGYSADRILPLLVALAIGLYLIHPLSSHRRTHIVVSTLALVAVSLVLFLPLLRYILSEPDSFLLRTLTRMGTQERQLAGPAIQIFLSNMGKALAMFSWSDGEIWVVSVPGYPALGIISGALFYLGAMLLLVRFLRHRHWLDIFLLLSIPVLMLPSTLSLAFPAENPNLYRTGGALVPVFLMAALALDGLMRTITAWLSSPWGKRVAWGLAIFLLAISAAQDYNLVFNKYYQLYQLSAWNTSEMGEVARGFVQSVGTPDNVWLMGFPHWVDSRLVPITAGFPGRDYALFVDQLPETEKIPGPKLFLVNPQDQAAIEALQQTYPRGWFQLYKSKVETKDFLIFFVPPQGSE